MQPLLAEEAEPCNRRDLYFLFRWLFQEVLLNLNLLRNNELVKFLNYQILRKNPSLLAYVKSKIQQGKPAQAHLILQGPPEEADYMRAIERAVAVLMEDSQVDYEVLLQEQLKEFYLLQPEQATIADKYYFIEKLEENSGNIEQQY